MNQGNTGVAVLLYDPKYQFAITKIERESGFKFERISAPKFDDVVESVVPQAAEAIVSVSDRYSSATRFSLFSYVLVFFQIITSHLSFVTETVWFPCSCLMLIKF